MAVMVVTTKGILSQGKGSKRAEQLLTNRFIIIGDHVAVPADLRLLREEVVSGNFDPNIGSYQSAFQLHRLLTNRDVLTARQGCGCRKFACRPQHCGCAKNKLPCCSACYCHKHGLKCQNLYCNT